jgi:WD40 repeat protein
LIAIGRTSDNIRLLETTSGLPIAKIEAPDRFQLSRLCFSKDGCHLLALDTMNNVHVWDLRSLRRALKSMNLDWALPPYPAEDDAHRLEPTRIELITAPERQNN